MDNLQPGFGLLKHDLQWRANRLKTAVNENGEMGEHEMKDGTEIEYHKTMAYLEDMDTAVAFFTAANEMLKILEKELFKQTFIKKDYRDGTIVGYVGNSCWDVFNKFEILDDELKESIKVTRDFRNELVHEPGGTQRETNIATLSDRIDTALEAVEELEDEVSKEEKS